MRWQPKSITKQITYSDTTKDMYTTTRQGCVEHIEISKAIRYFAYAPHRYNSEAKVLSRLVLTLDAVLTVACQIVSLRGATAAEGATCLDLMNVIDDEVMCNCE